jgi:hypothetical protein
MDDHSQKVLFYYDFSKSPCVNLLALSVAMPEPAPTASQTGVI